MDGVCETGPVTWLSPDRDVIDAYRNLRERVVGLLRSQPDEAGEIQVPACPAWTVRQLVAHMVGVPDDILAGRLEGVASDAWTDAQVGRLGRLPLDALADLFAEQASDFDSMLSRIPAPTNSQVVFDAVTHEHDLRHAIGKPAHRDSAAVTVGLGFMLQSAEGRHPGSADRLRALGLSDFELLRSLSGRRSTEQLKAAGLTTGEISLLFADLPVRPPIGDLHG